MFTTVFGGLDIVMKTLRCICIWKKINKRDGIRSIWYDYVNRVFKRCILPDYFINKDCIANIMKHAKVEERSID